MHACLRVYVCVLYLARESCNCSTDVCFVVVGSFRFGVGVVVGGGVAAVGVVVWGGINNLSICRGKEVLTVLRTTKCWPF